ncbi:MAG: hypothetical protein Q8P95_00625 [bacterium]|nr:hypothetical protein [bacterium]
MKRPAFLAIFAIALSVTVACGEADTTEEQGLSRQAFKSFSIDIPGSWRKIPQESFANTIPTETVAIFVRKVEGDDFIQNANVVVEAINTDASSLEYAKANILLGSKAIIDYRPLSTEEVVVGGVKTAFHLFRARSSGTDPLRHFSQSYFARDKMAYTVTCIAKEEDEPQQLACAGLVKSFQFSQN